MVDQNNALWAFSVLALAYILWIDFRPYIKDLLKKVSSKKEKNDPPDIVNAKNDLIVFSERYAIPACEKADEALRLATVAVVGLCKTSWHLNRLIAVGMRQHAEPDFSRWKAAANPDVVRNQTLSAVENNIKQSVVSYRVTKHTLYNIVRELDDINELDNKNDLKEAIENWLPYDDEYEKYFADLQDKPQLKIIRNMDFETYIADPRFPKTAFYKAIEESSGAPQG